MTTGYNVSLRNAQLDAITTFAGSGAILKILDGTRPATGGTATTVLASLTCGSPFAPAASSAVLSPTLPASAVAGVAGTATWFRLYKSDGTTQVIDGDVGATASGKEMELNSTSIALGATVSITGWTITRGNA